MKSEHDIDKCVRQLHRKASDDLNARVHTGIDQALADQQTTTTKGRIIMVNPITKLAAAAAMLIAAWLGLNWIGGPSAPGVAWGRIPDHVEAIDTFMFRLTISVSGENGAPVADEHAGQWTFYLSEKYGFRMDIGADGQTVVSWYVAPDSDTLTMVIPGEKKWSQSPLPPEQRGKMPAEYEDPADYIRRFLARPSQELGRSVIDGVEAEGIEVTDPPTKGEKLANSVGRLWVDVQTELPVRIEIEGTADGKQVQWLMEFQWSEAVNPAVFEPNIPSDYTPLAQ
jgi:outer membrane lipoprotein-sorting protein